MEIFTFISNYFENIECEEDGKVLDRLIRIKIGL